MLPGNLAQFVNLPAPSRPQGYFPAPGFVPFMGVHWLDGASPELGGATFTKTFIWGSYDGEFVFWEPMMTRDYLLTRPNEVIDLPQPAGFKKDGWYPTKYGMSYSRAGNEYNIALRDLQFRQGRSRVPPGKVNRRQALPDCFRENLVIYSIQGLNVMNRKSFLMGLSAAGVAPFVMGFDSLHKADYEAGLPEILAPDLSNSYWYIGHLISVLLSAKDTGGAFSLIHGYEIKGLEPPPHTHTREDESFYLLDGEITYKAGDKVMHAGKGNWVFLPRGIQHSFQVITEKAEVLMHLSPGGFEDYLSR